MLPINSASGPEVSLSSAALRINPARVSMLDALRRASISWASDTLNRILTVMGRDCLICLFLLILSGMRCCLLFVVFYYRALKASRALEPKLEGPFLGGGLGELIVIMFLVSHRYVFIDYDKSDGFKLFMKCSPSQKCG